MPSPLLLEGCVFIANTRLADCSAHNTINDVGEFGIAQQDFESAEWLVSLEHVMPFCRAQQRFLVRGRLGFGLSLPHGCDFLGAGDSEEDRV